MLPHAISITLARFESDFINFRYTSAYYHSRYMYIYRNLCLWIIEMPHNAVIYEIITENKSLLFNILKCCLNLKLQKIENYDN